MVDIERKFVYEALLCILVGINGYLMSHYIKFVADRLLNVLEYNECNVQNPFDWIELINLQGKTIFFEKRLGD